MWGNWVTIRPETEIKKLKQEITDLKQQVADLQADLNVAQEDALWYEKEWRDSE